MAQWPLGKSKDLWKWRVSFGPRFGRKHDLLWVGPWVNQLLTLHPELGWEEPSCPYGVRAALQTRARGSTVWCPEERLDVPFRALVAPALGLRALLWGLLASSTYGPPRAREGRKSVHSLPRSSCCRCRLEPWTPWTKTKPQAFATSFMTVLQVGPMGQ